MTSDSSSLVALITTQFLTVFNDNLLKQVVLLLAVQQVGTGFDQQALAGFVFAVPFLVFAGFAGDLADRFPKSLVILHAKHAEIFTMLFAAAAFATHSSTWIFLALTCIGIQSAFLGPAKYGSLPEISPNRLPQANSWMQASVLVAILLGMGIAGYAFQWGEDSLYQVGLIGAGIAVLGVLAAKKIRPLPAADPSRPLYFQPLRHARICLQLSGEIPGLRKLMLAHSLWWFVGGSLVFAWNEIGLLHFQAEAGIWSLGLAGLSVAIGAGCLIAGKLCKEIPKLKFSVLGGLVLGGCLLMASQWGHSPLRLFIFLAAGCFFGGFYLIPIRSLVQALPPASQKGRLLGASQLLDFSMIVAASIVKLIGHELGFNPFQILSFLAAIIWAGTYLCHKSSQEESRVDISTSKEIG